MKINRYYPDGTLKGDLLRKQVAKDTRHLMSVIRKEPNGTIITGFRVQVTKLDENIYDYKTL